MDKRVSTAGAALDDLVAGMSLAVGGFGLCGIPETLIEAVVASDVDDLHVISNNCGVDGAGLGRLLEAGKISKITASYVGENREFERRYLAGELEVELTPQGTLAERLHAGGAGIPAFYTPTGVGTDVEYGGVPTRYEHSGAVATFSKPRERRRFGDGEYVLEEAIRCDYTLVRAAFADRFGNLVFHAAARNFNPLCAMAARVTVVEAEELVDGFLEPDRIHLPGVFVTRVVAADPGLAKRIERLTLAHGDSSGS